MKKFLLIILIAFSQILANPISPDCTFKGKKLYGKIKVVTWGEDVKVRIVTSNEDLKVYLNTNTWTDRCGEWYFVDWGEDFKIRFVDWGEDFRIRYVGFSPGLGY